MTALGFHRLALAALLAAFAVACGPGSASTAIDPSTLVGTWVGEGVVLTVTDSGSHLERPCAHGDIPGAIAQNPFSVAGTFASDAGPGGPARPALYNGRVVGATMTLDIRLTDTNDSGGSFTLNRGSPSPMVKCV